MRKRKSNVAKGKQGKEPKLTMMILGILLILAISYIAWEKYNQNQNQKLEEIFVQGVNLGYEQAVFKLMKLALTCQPVPVFAENQTINMIAVECLKENSNEN